MAKRVLVAMSGGVDSSAAAALLLEQGYDVEGVTMQIWPDVSGEEKERVGGCCSMSAVDDARHVAYHLGIRYHVWNFKDVFENTVIEPFVKQYVCGQTPNPCILCNRYVKFEALLNRALALDFEYIATGHYGLIEKSADRFLLKRSVSDAKDQTYALYNLTQNQLAHLLLPVGTMSKPEIREYCKQKGIPTFDKPDSQEICFVRDDDYGGFIEQRGYKSIPGDFVDTKGNVLGRHKGIIHYTVGQRKGLGISFGRPMFVVRIDADKNEVVLGENTDVFCGELTARDLNFISMDALPESGFSCEVKIRYNAKPVRGAAFLIGEDHMRVVFESPERAVTPGQSVVLYTGDTVVGGGIIE